MQLFNYITKQLYSFDFEKWFSTLDDGSSYMKIWKDRLLSSYKTNIINSKIRLVYQYPININNTTIYLHLNIKHILNFPYKKEHVQKIRLADIGTPEDSKIMFYSPTDKFSIRSFLSNKPIILMQIPTSNGLQFVVIDGNHRVTSKKMGNSKFVRALFYVPGHSNDFASPFEYTLYQFIMELASNIVT